jgi:hypothetical protein
MNSSWLCGIKVYDMKCCEEWEIGLVEKTQIDPQPRFE